VNEEIRGKTEDLAMVDEATIASAPDNVTPIEEAKKPSKLELKRQQIYVDRMKRFIAKGMSAQEAQAAIAKEDFERLPVDKKLERLENILVMNLRAMYSDLQTIKQNQDVLADSMDINFKGFEKILAKLNVSDEDRKALMEEAEAEWKAERAAAAAQQAVQAEEDEKQEVAESVDQAGEAVEPTEADKFGE
jgi:uncharacterized protein YoaH (UPF0181 family)